ncbi:DUF4296 domain-containing protein [Flagellimonas aequoris]|uniref:DUF4296 domain-containing protein n=1 Tax=Flagellimonas aequoris TaxID=2306997 RepID=A0A418N712_9FLAO|nr:DUF4296 domain-containing protein [Allomuricauda aequoris]RIV70672.1 DUF4296 domain-containing protein [Allomuricauda aequoris]TXK02109.1 DUF4296 domain-containing protein [Allomuricauda aequoris]
MKRIAAGFLGLFLMVGCAEEVVKKPENLIPKEKMADILNDLAILNASTSAASNKFEDSGINIMEFLYKKYGIDSVQFSQSDLYYASVPLEYQSIYENIDAKLEERTKIMEERSMKKNDSIRKVNEARKDSLNANKDKKKVVPTKP